MNPVEFKGSNTVYGASQSMYLDLPAWASGDTVITCWKFGLWDRVRVFFGAPMWLSQLTFGEKLQPQKPSVDSPFVRDSDDA